MFYLIAETDFNTAGQPTDMLISGNPGRTNMSGDILIKGWLGTTNNVHREAHGEFATWDEARAAAALLGYTCSMPDSVLSDYEEWDEDGQCFQPIAEVLRTPEEAREQWDAREWFSPNTPEELGITANSTDSELDALAETLEAEANGSVEMERPYGVTLNGLNDYLREIRNELREEA